MKRFVFLLLALFLVASLSSCVKKASVAGTWRAEVDGAEILYEFKPDGTGTLSSGDKSADFTYALSGDKITVTVGEHTDSGSYILSGDSLKLTDEYGTTVLTRKKPER